MSAEQMAMAQAGGAGGAMDMGQGNVGAAMGAGIAPGEWDWMKSMPGMGGLVQPGMGLLGMANKPGMPPQTLQGPQIRPGQMSGAMPGMGGLMAGAFMPKRTAGRM